MRPMVDMEMTDEQSGDSPLPIPMPRETYPYGLRICLCNPQMEKLGLDAADAVVGAYVHIHALARITSVTATDGPSGPDSRVELQIEKMVPIESEEAENREAEREMPRKFALHTHKRS